MFSVFSVVAHRFSAVHDSERQICMFFSGALGFGDLSIFCGSHIEFRVSEHWISDHSKLSGITINPIQNSCMRP